MSKTGYQRNAPIQHNGGSPGGSKSKPASGSGPRSFGPAGGKIEDVYEGTASDQYQEDFGGMQGTHKGVAVTSPSGEKQYFSDKRKDARGASVHAGIIPTTEPAGQSIAPAGGSSRQMVRMNPIPTSPIGGEVPQMAPDLEEKN